MALLTHPIDGRGTHPDNPELDGAAGDGMIRLALANFVDEQRTPVDGPGAREISNAVLGEGDPNVPNPEGGSYLLNGFGQFVAHDLAGTAGDMETHLAIAIPAGDASFTPGDAIDFTRLPVDPESGEPINPVTSALDLSVVYGSDAETLAKLRAPDGKLLMSPDGTSLPTAPDGVSWLVGDGRALENPDLASMHVLWGENHNWLVDWLRENEPGLTPDALFERARELNISQYQKVVYTEYLHAMLGDNNLPEYQGFNPEASQKISSEFDVAAFRFGHSAATSYVASVDEHGDPIGQTLSLDQAFFLTPDQFQAAGGADGFIRGMADGLIAAVDARVVPEMRDMLIGAHGSTTLLDLGAINIERGRDVGLPYLNAMREELGLDRYDSFEALTSDVGTREALRQVYGGDIDKVELWVGGLAEDHVNGGLLGETFHRIVEDEFLRIREADPAYWENQDWSPEEHDLIAGTTMSDIILHNTGIRSIQDNPFMAAERRDFGDAPEHPELPQLIVSKGPGVLEPHHPQTDEMLA